MKIISNPLDGVDLEGKILIMKEETLAPRYRTLENRLWRATGGFGCAPTCIGRAIFARCLGDGEETRWERYDFEGWVTDETANTLLTKDKILGQLV